MKKKFLVLLCFSPFLMAQAQTKINVKEKNGANTPFVLTGLKTLTFTGGNLSVNKVVGGATIYSLANMRFMNFSDEITTKRVEENLNSYVANCYPNPVSDELNLSFGTNNEKPIQVELIGLDGKVQMSFKFSALTSHKTINVTALQKGVYFCHINNGNSLIKTTKFIKN